MNQLDCTQKITVLTDDNLFSMQVIIACHGIVGSSTNRYQRQTGTLSVKQYRFAQSDKTYIEWEPIDGNGIRKTNVDDLKRIEMKKRRCLLLMYKFDKWNLEYYFPRGNARAFVRMLEVTHSVKYQWTPIPFVMHFAIVGKHETIRRFPDLRIEHILGRTRTGLERMGKAIKSNEVCTDHFAIESEKLHCNRDARAEKGGFFTRVFRCVKMITVKIVNCPLLWRIVKTMGKLAANSIVSLVKTYVTRSPLVQKIRENGLSTNICGVAVNLTLPFLSSLLTGATRTIEQIYNDGCDGIRPLGIRHLLH